MRKQDAGECLHLFLAIAGRIMDNNISKAVSTGTEWSKRRPYMKLMIEQEMRHIK